MNGPLLPSGARHLLALLCLVGMALACDSEAIGLEEKRIGPDGGTAVLANGSVKLFIPPGALSEEIWFTVNPAFGVPASGLLVEGSSWEIGPPGTSFSRPVTVSIAYDPRSVPPDVGETGLGVFRVTGTGWSLLENAFVTPASHTASGEVRSLGRFGVSGLAVATLDLSPATAVLEPGDEVQLRAVPTASNGRPLTARPVTWNSSDSAIARVDSSGRVFALAEGDATVIATSQGIATESEIRVRISVAAVEVTPEVSALNLGQQVQLSARARDEDGTILTGRSVDWSSSDEDVASVNGNGRVTAVGAGSASIIATIDGRQGLGTVAVHPPLMISTTSLAAGVEGRTYSQTLAAMGGDGVYAWSVGSGSLPSGLDLDSSTGVIDGTPSAAGQSTFTVQVQSAGQVASKALAIEVARVPVASVSVLPALVSLVPSQSQQMSAIVRDASGNVLSGRTVSWSSGDEAVVSISGSGLLLAKAPGSTTVEANVEGHPGWAFVVVSDLLAIADTTLASGVVAEPYTHVLSAAGGEGGNTWSIIAGNLPPGLTLNPSTGEISGTPTMLGTTTFIVQVVSADGQVDSRSFSIEIRDLLTITAGALPDGVVGELYTEGLTAQGGVPPYTWSIAGDTLPTGLTLNLELGLISGRPIFEGTTSFTVGVTSKDQQTTSQSFSITVHEVPVSSVEVSPPSATVAAGQTVQLAVTAWDPFGEELFGRTTYWSSSNPSVASVDIDGVVTGVSVGSSTVTATVDGVTDLSTITVFEVLTIQTTSLANGVVGTPYSQGLAATGGDGTYGWTLTGGSLPAGLSLDGSTGIISGTPASSGTSTFLVQVISGGQTATTLLSLVIG